MNCTQPGCAGHVEDGYCNVCGTPAPVEIDVRGATAPDVAPSSASQLPRSPTGTAHAAYTGQTRRSSPTRASFRHLGAAITSIPPVAAQDPLSMIRADPNIPEERRFCANPGCGVSVGRPSDGRPGRTHGFCAKCGTKFSFEPRLHPGDLVSDQYEVVGVLAYGGLGWIYLARDRNVANRWTVLKGLRDASDPDAYQAAVTERIFLSENHHPQIVNIYNFAMHDDAGYIVMEYLDGKSIKEILEARKAANDGQYNPLPADQAIDYIIEILPAFSYLHDQQRLYCDFKPDNMIQTPDGVKLIDLGGVRRLDDSDSPIYGTVGFEAPELPTVVPNVTSDIYTVGRTLALLLINFRSYQSTDKHRLPPLDDTPLFQRYDSLYRLLKKATAHQPDDRFQSADELRNQLIAVRREVVASDRPDGPAPPSVLFGTPVTSPTAMDWHQLPPLLVDDTDPFASWLAGISINDPKQRLRALDDPPHLDPPHLDPPHDSVELRLARARAAIDDDQLDLAATTIQQILSNDPWEWRAIWLTGLAALTPNGAGANAATEAFNAVLGEVPGELAPKLALALACERAGHRQIAGSLYLTCAIVDANYVAPAAFGLARTALADGDVHSALSALDRIGPTSAAYTSARRTRAEILLDSGTGLAALADAAAAGAEVLVDPREWHQFLVKVLVRALDNVRGGRDQPEIAISGIPATEHDLRVGAELAYRDLAVLTSDRAERNRLVDAANAVRPRTLR